MKLKFWMQIYPHQMADPVQFKPYVSATPLSAPDTGSKVLSFTVDIPDNLFGTQEIQASAPVEEAK